MKKSTLIAKCMVNSEMYARLEDAETRVQQVFADEFPNSDFAEWNSELNDQVAQERIQAVGSTSRINVKRFIEVLW